MQELVARFSALLAQHHPALAETLKPPAPAKGGPWSRLEGELGFTLPEDVHALYAVHNGQRPKRPGVFEGQRWLGLDEVLEHYLDLEGEHGTADWPDAWVPFAADAHHWLVVDFSEAPAPVLRVDRDGVPTQVAATLKGYVSAQVRALEQAR